MKNNKLKVELRWVGKTRDIKKEVFSFETLKFNEGNKEYQSTLNGLDDWSNKLFWGDNKLIMSSLLQQGWAKKIDLIYIDPPYNTGKNFLTKTGELVYNDKWDLNSYLQFIYERLVLIRELLSEQGSIYVHIDWHVGHYVKVIMDEIFGKENFRNEIIWSYFRYTARSNDFQKMHDTLFRYTKSDKAIFNQLYEEYQETTLKYHKWEKDEQGREFYWKRGKGIKPYKIYKSEGVALNDVWKIPQIGPIGKERLGYATQKPEILISRIIRASTNKNSVVADFFAGSGTTGAVAEKLGRKWIMSDLSKFAIHTTRKRMVNVQKQLKKEGKPFRKFVVLKLKEKC